MRTSTLLRRCSLPILVFLSLFLAACREDGPTSSTGPASKIISGILNDEQGFSVPGAYIEALDAANARVSFDTTDDMGAFTLDNVTGDLSKMQLHVIRQDFKPFMANVQGIISAAGGHDGVILSMLHDDSCCARLTIQVSAGANNGRLAGVEVKLRRGNSDHLVTTGITDADGRVTFTNVCHGEFNVRIAKAGYNVVERGGIAVHGCDSTLLEFQMQENNDHHEGNGDSCCNGVLRIIPKDSATGAVLTGASIRINKAGGNARTIVSNGDGSIFREVCSGTYNVRIAKDGYHVVEFSITVACNDSVRTERLLVPNGDNGGGHNGDSCCHGHITIIVRDSATNAVIPNATVKIWKNGVLLETATTNGDGRATVDGLCNGDYTVDILREHYRHQEVHVGLGCNGSYQETYRLGAEGGDNNGDSCCQGRVQINVQDAEGHALNGVTVKLWKGNQLIATKASAEGRAVFEGLCTGSYSISMSKDGYTAQEFAFTLTCNQRYEETKHLQGANTPGDSCCNAVMRFRVKRDGSQDGWLSGVTVTIKKGDDVIATGTTNGDGNYNREAICGHATYTVTFSKDGYHTKTVSYTFTDCRTINETINLVQN
jgi:uncharacterized surface anchored protein